MGKNVLDRSQTLKLKIARKRKYYGEQILLEEGLIDEPEIKEIKNEKITEKKNN